ncbi:MAG: hypothetical protein D5R96_09305 [Methanocalculus sp. MSAO_Arc2]|uniref:hypothetical protein n=1 Tax=Methanocalculus sp. MSAO_Arc2 TaxID=2293855 RepID=UPI000FF727EF|nr:MAG: hypothetical protein D5R96_09305 [Methanocalculus sp. MSAO_Arc2]
MNPCVVWKGEKRLPTGMKAIVERAIPADVVKEGIRFFVHGKTPAVEKPSRALGVCRRRNPDVVDGETPQTEIHIFLWKILFHEHGGGKGVNQYRAWKHTLDVILHEIGHAATREQFTNVSYEQYEQRGAEYSFVERLANEWRDDAIRAIVKKDPRLGQPEGWIGGLPGVYLSRQMKKRTPGEAWGRASNARINDYRAYRCGGQFTLTDATDHVKQLLPKDYNWREGMLRDFIKREAPTLGITRHYVDGAGRKHLFFNYGELLKVADHVLVSPKFFTKVLRGEAR